MGSSERGQYCFLWLVQNKIKDVYLHWVLWVCCIKRIGRTFIPFMRWRCCQCFSKASCCCKSKNLIRLKKIKNRQRWPEICVYALWLNTPHRDEKHRQQCYFIIPAETSHSQHGTLQQKVLNKWATSSDFSLQALVCSSKAQQTKMFNSSLDQRA